MRAEKVSRGGGRERESKDRVADNKQLDVQVAFRLLSLRRVFIFGAKYSTL